MTLRVIMLGDVVGRAGRAAIKQQVPLLRETWQADYVIVNVENATNGSGLSINHYRKFLDAGVDGMTLGDHALRRTEIVKILKSEKNIIRPANLSTHAEGRGLMRIERDKLPPLYVIILLGRMFMPLMANDPFETVDKLLQSIEPGACVIVEMHAETTSEKIAMGWYLNGRVSAVVGSHTHVPTADARILSESGLGAASGTAFITDLGMSGPYHSVIGRNIKPVLTHMTTSMHLPFDVADGDPRVNGVFLELDTKTGRATKIERIEVKANTNTPPFTG